MANESVELVVLFAPWRHENGKLLGGGVFDACNLLAEERTLWLEWDPFDEDISAAAKQLECLELLDLVAQINTTVFQSLLSEICDDIPLLIIEQPVCMHWRLGLQIQLDGGVNSEYLRECFGWNNVGEDATSRVRSAGYQNAEHILETLVDPASRRPPIPLRFVVEAGPDGNIDTFDTLAQVRELARVARASTNRALSTRSFRFNQCTIEFPSGSTTTEFLRLVVDIIRTGVRVERLLLNREFGEEPLDSMVLMQAIRTLLLPQDGGCGVMWLSLHTQMEPRFLIPVCSALVQSPSVRRVVIDTFYGGAQDPRHQIAWRWLTWSLFSRRAAHAIESLELYVSGLTANDVSIIETIAHSNDPLRTAINLECEVFSATLAGATDVWLSKPGLDGSPPDISWEFAKCRVDVLDSGRTEDRWCQVLMPGIGVCWVLRECVRAQNAGIMAVDHGRQGFRSLVLGGLSERNAESALRLLQLIAHDTTKLELRNWNQASGFQPWIAQCVSACPVVQELVISTHHDDALDGLLEVFNSDGTSPLGQLSDLKLESMFASRGCQNLHRLLVTLVNPHHPLTSTLRHLSISAIDMSTENVGILWDSVLYSFMRMLQLNKTLVSCRLRLPKSSSNVRDRRVREFCAFDGEALARRAGPLALSSKLAFLSAVASHPLSSDAIALVFSFAAPCARRICVFL